MASPAREDMFKRFTKRPRVRLIGTDVEIDLTDGSADAAATDAESAQSTDCHPDPTACLKAVLSSALEARLLLRPIRDDRDDLVDLRCLVANDQARKFLGSPAQEGLDLSVANSSAGVGQDTVFAKVHKALTDGQRLVETDSRLIDPRTGAEHWVDIEATPLADLVLVSWREVTEQHLTRTQVQESERLYRLLAHNTTEIVVLICEPGIVRWVSPALTHSLGWRPEHWVGQPLEDFVHSGDRACLAARRAVVAAGTPLIARLRIQDRTGAYHWAQTHESPFVDDDHKITGHIIRLTIIDDQVETEELLEHRATHDPLTGLLNRQATHTRLAWLIERGRRHGHALFVGFLDVDNLKQVNDSLGHGAGDRILCAIADRAKARLRSDDAIGRVGGDELLLLLPGMRDAPTAVRVAEELLCDVCRPVDLDAGRRLVPSLSIGLAEVGSDDTLQEAIARADAAMYQAKSGGGGRVHLHHPSASPAD